MSKDYVLFIHGVNTRQEPEKPSYADELFEGIRSHAESLAIRDNIDPPLKLEKIALFWGDVGTEAQKNLIKDFESLDEWSKFWFREFRKKQLLQFAGDAAVYISRTVGSQVVKKLKEDARKGLGEITSADRLHLVTHSWGTVILFDILFADRWDIKDVPGHDDVAEIRNLLFGMGRDPQRGIYLASIHTMGSPVALFSLVSVGESGHDLSPKLEELLKNLHEQIMNGNKLPWQNFAHPGDPIAWPLSSTIPRVLYRIEKKFLPEVQDIVIPNQAGPLDFMAQLVNQTPLSMLLNGGNAHESYWKNKEVAQRISDTILKVSLQIKTKTEE